MKRSKNSINIVFLSVLALLMTESGLRAQEGSEPLFDISGFIMNKNIISTYTKQDLKDADKKNELRANIKLKYGTDNIYLYLNSGLSMVPLMINGDYRYSGEISLTRNGTISGTFYEFYAREFYVNMSFDSFRFRLGNQVYGWGTADVFNPTSYFNPGDLRELFFREEDELKQGVPSLSSMIFLGNYTLELVFVPVHVPSLFAAEGNFWEITYIEGPFPVYVTNSEGMPVSAANFAYGGRFATTLFGADISLSAYHGPDRDPLLRPSRTVLAPGEPVSIEVVPEYYIVNSFGADASMSFDKFVVQGEISFTPDKTVCIDQPYTTGMTLPFETQKVKSLSYTAGFNYFIPLSRLIEDHGGTTVLTVEWMQTIYYGSGCMEPMITDIITARLEDSFLDERLKPSATVIWDTKNSGAAFSVKAGWDFQNGLSVNLEYWNISGSGDSVLGYFKDNDFVSVGVKYEF